MVVNPYTVGSGIMPGVEGGDTQMASIFGSQGLGIQYVTYYGPNGETITIQTFNGSPMTPVPEGYTKTPPVAVAPTAPAGDTAAPVAAPQDNNDNDNGGGNQPEPKTNEEIQADVLDRFADIDFDDLGTSVNKRIEELTKKDPEGFFGSMLISKIGAGLNRVSEVGEINALINVIEKTEGIDAANAYRDSLAIQMKNEGIVVPTGMGTGKWYEKDLYDPFTGILGQDGKRHKLTTDELTALGKEKKAQEKAAQAQAQAAQAQAAQAQAAQAQAAQDAANAAFTNRASSASEAESRSSDRQSAANIAAKEAGAKQNRDNNYSVTSTAAARTKETSAAPAAKAVVEKYGTRAYRAKGGLMTKKK
jgi:hypothetical protein